MVRPRSEASIPRLRANAGFSILDRSLLRSRLNVRAAVRGSVSIATLVLLAITVGCTSMCDNAGVTVDGHGNVVVRGESGFISPNSTILRNVTEWPQPPSGEENFSFSQGYTLTRDGAMYVLENTAGHPNLVYRIDLSNGHLAPIGSHERDGANAALASSNETFIAATTRYVYSVDQKDPVISRADLSRSDPTLTVLIAGPKTQLRSPIAVAAMDKGFICALDSETTFVLCYPADARGDVPPARVIDLKKALRYAQGYDLTFDRSRHIVVSGTSDSSGASENSVAVIDIATAAPRVVRVISGPNTRLMAPELAADKSGNILVLQAISSNGPFEPGDLLAFGPRQRGNVAPRFVRSPAANVTHPFRFATDPRTGDVAILGSDGIALFRGAARLPPREWPAAIHLPYRGWAVAFGGQSSLLVADEFGRIEKHIVNGASKAPGMTNGPPLNLNDPEFIATDQVGNLYVAATSGVITALPKHSETSNAWHARSFKTDFGRNMDAFAPDSAGYFYFSSRSNNAILTVEPKNHQSAISGSETGLNGPLGLAVNSDGSLFVANPGDKNILVFARGSAGNTAPIDRIEGPATQLIAPQALAIDAKGRLYVFDGPQTTSVGGGRHYVRVYSADARGNVAPLASYEVTTKCWTNAV